MSTRVIKEGNVTTTIMDLTNGVGDKSAEVREEAIQNQNRCKVSKSKLRDINIKMVTTDHANSHKIFT